MLVLVRIIMYCIFEFILNWKILIIKMIVVYIIVYLDYKYGIGICL